MTQKKLRIGVFGISRSGKDYTIEGAVRILSRRGRDFGHISMIKVVHKNLGTSKLSEMTRDEKLLLMDKVHEDMDDESSRSDVIIDEHYCFPKTYGGMTQVNRYSMEKLPFRDVYDEEADLSYEVVFDEREIGKYDDVYFLDIDPAVVLDRFRSSEGDKRNLDITLNDVRCWILHEKYAVKSLCERYGVPFHLLKDPETTSADLAEGILSLGAE